MQEDGESRQDEAEGGKAIIDESSYDTAVGDYADTRPRRPADTPAPTSASSQRWLVPPDRPPPNWWSRHRQKVQAAEWVCTLAFFGVAGYYLWLLLFPPAPVVLPPATPPTREEFRLRLRSLAPIPADPDWDVQAQIGRWRSIVIHHSATDSGSPESFDRYHREVRKWENGLGYHFVIGNGNGMPDGAVSVGGRWRDQLDGAHVKGKDNANSYSIGVCLVGNFNDSVPTARQLASLKGLLAFLRKQYGIGLAAIVGHNAVATDHTDCPGKFFFVEEVALALANP